VLLLPWMLHRLCAGSDVRWDVEPLINIPTTMLVGIVLVIFAFNVALPISELSPHHGPRHAGHRAGLRDAGLPDDDHAAEGGAAGDRLPGDGKRPVLRRHQRPPTACRWWSNWASRSTCWSACIILGVFFFQIRDQFDSLDIRHLEKLKDD
jgi:hydrogenase-4 component E